MSEPVVRNNEAEGRFETEVDGAVVYTQYRRLASGILFPHTETPPPLQGRGLAGLVVRAALDWARAEGALVLPTCPYVSAWIVRHPDYHDLVHPDYRTALGI